MPHSFKELLRQNLYKFIEDLPKRVGETPKEVVVNYFLSQFTSHLEHLAAEVEGLERDEKEINSALMTKKFGYSYDQAYNQALSDVLALLKK